MIRTDKTKTSKIDRAHWELEVLEAQTDSDKDRVSGATKFWNNMAEKLDRGELREGEIRDLELTRRIAGITTTPEESRAQRAEVIKRQDRATDAVKGDYRGQSEEEYQEELKKLNRKYQRAING